ncbi:DUF4124 domain-containing protein [Francisella sp. LA112445]|uniref:DUF4124 domain-containing protein n=1 Tax=Francisella sp. LA112445 TaxID=1395624 RepID=UPI001788CA6E|nr:DUF4124 domain-containing protein [Francisella sp. LA112445]QIW10759.1 DUF4124 domain-containing protein [Francisella sp. LA112445]
MSKFNKVIFSLIFAAYSGSVFADNGTTLVYSWRSETGNVVFSETKPSGDIDYKTIEVGKPTIINPEGKQSISKAAAAATTKKVNINQSDIQKLSGSTLAEKNMQTLGNENQNSDLNVQIISPKQDANIFTKDENIPIVTTPEISPDDKPIFIVNGATIPATFENGQWQIPRPTPGQIELSIAGQTSNGMNIHSINEVTFFVRNGWLAQSVNNQKHKPVYSS